MVVTRLLPLLAALSLAAPAGTQIAGQVLDAEGWPVPEAEVYARVRPSGTPSVPPVDAEEWSGRTDAGGSFSLPYDGRERYVIAVAPGKGLGTTSAGSRSTGLPFPVVGELLRPKGDVKAVIRLPEERLVVGRILGPDGHPLEGATVRVAAVLLGTDLNHWIELPAPLRARYTTQTDNAGVYRLSGLYPLGVVLEAEAPGLAVRRFRLNAGPPDQRLEPACRIRGRLVEGEAGLAGRIIGIQLRAFGTAPAVEITTPGPGRAVTDATGRFELAGLPAGDYQVHPVGWGDDETKKVAVVRASVTAEHPEAEVLLRAVEPAVIIGHTVDPETGEPVPRSSPSMEAPEHWREFDEIPRGTQVFSGADGSFRVRVAPGQVRFRCGGDTVEVTAVAGRETEVNLVVGYYRVLAGTVYGSDGKPAGGVRVVARQVDPWYDKATITGADGHFELVRMDEWPCRLTVAPRADGSGVLFPIAVRPPFPRDLQVRLVPLPQIALVGRVVDERDRPAPNVRVELTHVTDEPGGPRRENVAHALSDADGGYRFVVREVTGHYEATTTARSGTRSDEGGRPVGDDGAERRFTDLVVLSMKNALAGQLLDAAGRPARGVAVRWIGGGEYAAHRAVTDDQGRFRLENLPDRPVLLLARDDRLGYVMEWAMPGQEVLLKLAGGE